MIQALKKLFVVSRPVSWVNTAYPFAAGYLLTTRHIDVTFIIGSLYFLIPYNLMMYGVNDVFDYESDKNNQRKGGVEGALLAKKQHKLVLITTALVNLPFLVLLYILSSTIMSTIILSMVVFLVLAYSLPILRFKERPFIDSLTSSLHFVGPLIFGLSFSGFSTTSLLIVVGFFLWGMASHAFGAVQDIQADRAGGIGSIATMIGAQKTVWLSILLYAASGLVIASIGGAAIIAALINLFYIVNIIPFLHLIDADAEQANAGWKRFLKINYLAGFIVTMLLIAVSGILGG